ncbi:MAG: phosphatase PAP2 family protein [Pyrinomonadaceae bacterium]|nr:phosphatase PAP2 family protein [Pyrinomonadaceae bacterium]
MFKRLVSAFPVRLAAGFTASATVLALVGILLLDNQFVAALDAAARGIAAQAANDELTWIFKLVTRFGSTLYLTVIGCLAVILFLSLRWYRATWLFLIASAGQIVLHLGFKYLIGRGRPEPLVEYAIDDSYSFPSGHALAGLVIYLTIAWLVVNQLSARTLRFAIAGAVIIMIIAIGLSRVYFGVHHLTDVFAGWLAGLLWTAAVMSGDEPAVSPNEKTA